jgi:hypothetical protein
MRQFKCQYNYDLSYALFQATKQKVKCLSLNEQTAVPPPTVVYNKSFQQLVRGPSPLRGLISAGPQIPVILTIQCDTKFGSSLENPLLFRFLNDKKLRNDLSVKAEADSELSCRQQLTSTC